jgi:DNA-binding beta-propeller fold protein YncE
LFAVVAALAIAPTATAGDPVATTTLPLGSYYDLAVDSSTNRVFVSGGPGSSTIIVLDYDGNVTGAIPDQPGASDLVVNPATSRLYVALQDEGKTSMINTATLAEVQRTTGAIGWNPVIAGGRIWYSNGSDGIVSVGLDLTSPMTYSEFGTYPASLGTLASASGNANVLAAAAVGASPSALFTYSLSGGMPSLLAPGNGGSNLGDIALSPDGSHVFTAAAAPYELQDFRTSDLELLTTYPTGPYPGGVDVSSGGGLVGASTEGEVFVFAVGSSDLRNRFTIGSFEGGLVNGSSVAFAPDGKRLFAVTGGGGPPVKFRVLHDSDLFGATLTLRTTTPLVKHPVTISGDLTFMDGAAAGVPVEITLVDELGTRTPIATVNTDGAGHYSYTDPLSLPAVGTYTYEASWEGDETHGEAIAEKMVLAQKSTPVLKVTVSDAKIRFGQSITVRVHLTGGLSNTEVAVYAEDVHGGRTLLAHFWHKGTWTVTACSRAAPSRKRTRSTWRNTPATRRSPTRARLEP